MMVGGFRANREVVQCKGEDVFSVLVDVVCNARAFVALLASRLSVLCH